jgi:hypothetical protein
MVEIKFKRNMKTIFSYYAGGQENLVFYDDLKRIRKTFGFANAIEEVITW